MRPPNQPPLVTITAPDDGLNFDTEESITFTGTAIPPGGGEICGDLVWTSDRDGLIGTGCIISTTPSSLSEGTHVITASVTDGEGASGSDTITVTVSVGPPSGEGYCVSINLDYSPCVDSAFNQSDTMYIKIWSDWVDHTNMEKAEGELKIRGQRFKDNLTNNHDGTFTGRIDMSTVPTGTGTLKLILEDMSRNKYEVKNLPITVTK